MAIGYGRDQLATFDQLGSLEDGPCGTFLVVMGACYGAGVNWEVQAGCVIKRSRLRFPLGQGFACTSGPVRTYLPTGCR